jgi:hypothetical protein
MIRNSHVCNRLLKTQKKTAGAKILNEALNLQPSFHEQRRLQLDGVPDIAAAFGCAGINRHKTETALKMMAVRCNRSTNNSSKIENDCPFSSFFKEGKDHRLSPKIPEAARQP